MTSGSSDAPWRKSSCSTSSESSHWWLGTIRWVRAWQHFYIAQYSLEEYLFYFIQSQKSGLEGAQLYIKIEIIEIISFWFDALELWNSYWQVNVSVFRTYFTFNKKYFTLNFALFKSGYCMHANDILSRLSKSHVKFEI